MTVKRLIEAVAEKLESEWLTGVVAVDDVDFATKVAECFGLPVIEQPTVGRVAVVGRVMDVDKMRDAIASVGCPYVTACGECKPSQSYMIDVVGRVVDFSQYPVDVDTYVANNFERKIEVQLVTTHFNPCQYKRLRKTYYEWIPTLGPLADRLLCYELVLDDDEPEIDGSIVIRGTRTKNVMWQKERMINIALAKCDPVIKHFAWVDHDLVFENPDWLSDGIKQIDEGFPAVQLFDEIIRLGIDQVAESSRLGAVAGIKTGQRRSSNPGGAWIADRSFLDEIGGLNSENLFGGGDQVWLDGLLNEPGFHLREYSHLLAKSLREWIAKVGKMMGDRKPTHIPGRCFHLWHGTHANRQYKTRNKVLVNANFDPEKDIRINDDGLIEWASDKPKLHQALRDFFVNRNEDESS